MKALYLMAATALALGACNRSPADGDAAKNANGASVDPTNMSLATPPPATPGDAGVTTDPALYAAQAGAGDMFEIQSSKAILDKTKNADVRRFAQMMIDNHTSSTSQIKAAAATDKVTLTAPTLQADQQAMLDDIRSADAATADRVYLQHQRTAHSAALALHQGFARSQNAGQLRQAADKIAAVVQKHLAELDKVEASVIGGR